MTGLVLLFQWKVAFVEQLFYWSELTMAVVEVSVIVIGRHFLSMVMTIPQF